MTNYEYKKELLRIEWMTFKRELKQAWSNLLQSMKA